MEYSNVTEVHIMDLKRNQSIIYLGLGIDSPQIEISTLFM